jgi:hypothetical protein
VTKVPNRGVIYSLVLVEFASVPPWCGKHLSVGAASRLITAESPISCRFCLGEHVCKACKEPGSFSFATGDIVTVEEWTLEL